jgi:hypothetical protein
MKRALRVPGDLINNRNQRMKYTTRQSAIILLNDGTIFHGNQ